MARLSRFTGALLLVALAAAPAAGGDQVHKTPQEAFDALMAAVRKDDWKSACASLTNESFTKASAGLLLVGMFTRDVLEKFGAQDKQSKFKESLEALNGAFEKHGLTRENLRKINIKIILDPVGQKDPKRLAKVHAQLTAVVKDRGAFLDDFVKTLRKMPGNALVRPIPEGELTDLKTEGDAARGTLITRKDGREQRRPIRFRKVGDGWKVDVEPNFGGPGARSSLTAPRPALSATGPAAGRDGRRSAL